MAEFYASEVLDPYTESLLLHQDIFGDCGEMGIVGSVECRI
ncbi:hypothetical protein [Moorena producens]|nr:hypothetical protein [Moorena producens]